MSLELLFSFLGLGVLVWRTKPWRTPRATSPLVIAETLPAMVSIIVPCRNEEKNIARFLRAVDAFTLKAEIIVVDDGSSDRTFEVALKSRVARVIKAPAKPEGWVGKSWACHHGALVARGQILLFTDADTCHRADSLQKALSFFKEQQADLISCPPHHACENLFEKALGLFHVLPLIATAFLEKPKVNRLYSIGQYLMIDRRAYDRIGGHEELKDSLTEDIDMAQAVCANGLRYAVYPDANLYDVQMYRTAKEFWIGWKRLLRLGMRKASPVAFVEIVLVFHLFWDFSLATLAGLFALAWIQRQHGNFSAWGVLLAPISIVLFTLMSIIGLAETLLNRKVVWRERSYLRP